MDGWMDGWPNWSEFACMRHARVVIVGGAWVLSVDGRITLFKNKKKNVIST